ncbi:hypothetical protein IQ227_07220 [Anabaena aphanizomenioides LEGE 00250]|uniref:Uncharacterized protein n=1 Tax=Sphaerospermopsis aphanizomenoides LEGE 00250 TaxID=2777972 RepID=A0ABR9VBH1_9CYAN|nr:hypothetical protein [Sphaerospermopsis aphanizomenoides]MBE9235831.1 hypothetical protein [Sphaerospermopsis aphanizomenoides LEGE 00250]
MAEPTITQIFGAGATQSNTQLAILKADLSGLTATSNNTAESMIVALLLLWEATLTTTAQESNPDQSIRVEKGSESLNTVFNNGTSTQYKEIPFTITLRKPYIATTIDPDDY